MQETARVDGRHDLGARGLVGGEPVEAHALGHRRLGDGERAAEAAALVRARGRDELETF